MALKDDHYLLIGPRYIEFNLPQPTDVRAEFQECQTLGDSRFSGQIEDVTGQRRKATPLDWPRRSSESVVEGAQLRIVHIVSCFVCCYYVRHSRNPNTGTNSMHTDLLPHALNREFPELADAVAALKENDLHFVHLLKQHDAVDDQITKDEMGVAPMGDTSLEDLKKQRLRLKDELYRMAIAAKKTG